MSDETKVPFKETGPENAAEDAAQQGQKLVKQQVTANLAVTGDVEPSRQAEYIKIAKQHNTNPEFVKNNYEQFKPLAAKKNINTARLTEEAPQAAKWMTDPSNAALAKNDVERLTELEKRARTFAPKSAKKDEGNYLKDLHKASRTGGYQLHQSALFLAVAHGKMSVDDAAEDIAILSELMAEQHKTRPKYVEELDKVFEASGEDFNKATQEWQAGLKRMESEDILERLKGLGAASKAGGSQVLNFFDFVGEITVGNPKAAGYISAESLVNSVPALAGGLGLGALGGMTGPAAPVMAPLGFLGGTFGGSYAVEYGASLTEDLNKRGVNLSDAAAIAKALRDPKMMAEIKDRANKKGVGTAATDALLSLLITRYGVKSASLMKASMAQTARRAGTTAVKTAAEMAAEGIAEGVGQAAREGDIGAIDLREVGLEIAAAGPQSAITAVGGEAIQMKAESERVKAVEEIRAEFSQDPVTAAKEITERVVTDQATLSKLEQAEKAIEQVEQMEGVTLAPDKIDEVVESMTGGHDGDQMYFQADDWDAHWNDQGISPVEMADKLLGDNVAQYYESKNTGNMITVPASTFIAKAGQDAQIRELLDIARTEPDGVTRVEAEKRLKDTGELMNRLAEEAVAQEDQQSEADRDQLSEAVKQKTDELRAAQPEISAQDAKRQALVFEGGVRALAERTGMTIEQFLQKYPLTVGRGEARPSALRPAEAIQKDIDALDGDTPEVKARKNELQEELTRSEEEGAADKKVLYQEDHKEIKFYSKAIKLIEKKMGKKPMRVEQIRGLLKGISKEEQKWLGLDEFLGGRKLVGKQELLDYLSGNMLEITDITDEFPDQEEGTFKADDIFWPDTEVVEPSEETLQEEINHILEDPESSSLSHEWEDHKMFAEKTYYEENAPEDQEEHTPFDELPEKHQKAFLLSFQDEYAERAREEAYERLTDSDNGVWTSTERETDWKIEGNDDMGWSVIDSDGDVRSRGHGSSDDAESSAYEYMYDDGLIFSEDSESQFKEYTLPGGWNYTEKKYEHQRHDRKKLAHAKIDQLWRQIEADLEERLGDKAAAITENPHPHIESMKNQGARYWNDDAASPKIKELADKIKSIDDSLKSFHGGHFDSDTLAHTRTKDRLTEDGEPTSHVEEVQTDWHKEVGPFGYIGDEVPQKILDKAKAQADEIAKLEAEIETEKERALNVLAEKETKLAEITKKIESKNFTNFMSLDNFLSSSRREDSIEYEAPEVVSKALGYRAKELNVTEYQIKEKVYTGREYSVEEIQRLDIGSPFGQTGRDIIIELMELESKTFKEAIEAEINIKQNTMVESFAEHLEIMNDFELSGKYLHEFSFNADNVDRMWMKPGETEQEIRSRVTEVLKQYYKEELLAAQTKQGRGGPISADKMMVDVLLHTFNMHRMDRRVEIRDAFKAGNKDKVLKILEDHGFSHPETRYNAILADEAFSNALEVSQVEVAEIKLATEQDIEKYTAINEEFTEAWRSSRDARDFKAEELSKLRSERIEFNTRVDGPFRENWHEFVMKRELIDAVRRGSKSLTWTTGDQQVERYRNALTKSVNVITYNKETGEFNGMKGDKSIHNAIYKDKAELAGVIGKAGANQIFDAEANEDGVVEIDSGDLRIGGAFMRTLYDEKLVKFVGKLVKQAGAKVEMGKIHIGETLDDGKYADAHMVKITPELVKYLQDEGLTLFQKDDQSSKPRGLIRFGGPEGFQIELLANANKSTFFHEMGHYYLEVLGDLAEDSSAPQDVKDDHQVLLDWFGVESRDQITTEHHELFARGFEAYIMEGKAPSLKLKKVFHRFQAWLVDWYKTLRGLEAEAGFEVKLSEDVRNVMGRLLATQAEISEAAAKYGLLADLPLGQNLKSLTDPRTFGMTGKAAERYTEAVEEARRAAEEELQAEMMAGYKRENEKAWRVERAKVKEEVLLELNDQPMYKALTVLQRGKLPDGSPAPQGLEDLKLNRKDLVEIYGSDFVKDTLPRPFIYSREGGQHPDIVAPYFGYDSGDEMIQDLIVAQPLKQFVDQEAQRRMMQKYPDVIMDTAAMEAKAIKAIHNEKQSKLYNMMLEWLWKNKKGVTKDVFRRGVRGLPSTSDMRELADDTLGNRQIRNIRPHLFIAAQKRANKEAAKSLAAGDFNSAYKHLEVAAINHELMKASYKVNDKIRKSKDKFKKFKQSDEKLAKTREVDYIQAARAILTKYIGKGAIENPLDHLTQLRAYNPEGYLQAATQIEQLNDIPPRETFKDLTLDEFERISEVVEALWDMSREAKTIEKDGVKMEIELAADEMISQIEQVDTKKERRKYDEDADNRDKTKSNLLSIKAMYRRVEHWVEAMDQGDPDGPFRKFLWEPISEATDRYQIELVEYKKRLVDMYKTIEPGITPEPIESDELGFKFRDKAQLLGAMMHMGNEGNLRKLLLGRAWGTENEDRSLNTDQWDAFMERMYSEGIITKVDVDFIQGIWDLYEELKPAAQKAHKKVFGFYFNEVTANEFETPFGMYKGGYAPANIDPNPPKQGPARAYSIADKQKMEELAQGHSSFNWPAAGGTGQYKSRVATFNMPLSMELSHVTRHLDTSLRFIHIKPLVINASKLVSNPRVRARLTDFDEAVVNDMLFPYLSRADKNRPETLEGKGASFVWRGLNKVRNRIAMQWMFGNVKNVVEQTSGFFPALVKVEAKYMSDAAGVYFAGMKTTSDDIAEKSDFMKIRFDAQVFDLNMRIDDVLTPKSKLETVQAYAKKHTYFMQSLLQNHMDRIIWLGAYNQNIAAGHGEKKSSRMADAAIRETQMSIRPLDVSAMEADPYVRIFSMFFGFFNNMANLNMTEFNKIITSDMSLKDKYKRGTFVYLSAFASLAIASELVARALGGGLDDDDDGLYIDDAMEILFGSQLKMGIAMTGPASGPLRAMYGSVFTDQKWDDRVSASPVAEAISVAIQTPLRVTKKAAQGGDMTSRDVKDIMTALGISLGLPVMPMSKPALYYMDVQSGRANPTGPVDFTRGLITGHKGKK